MPSFVLLRGTYTVEAFSRLGEDYNTKTPALDFLQEMSGQKAYAANAVAFKTLFQRYAEGGRQNLTTVLFHEADKSEGIWEFIKGDLRVFCFIHLNSVILTNGTIKKTGKADPKAVSLAVGYKKEYLNI